MMSQLMKNAEVVASLRSSLADVDRWWRGPVVVVRRYVTPRSQ
jgi:hypothetical protein